MKNDLKYWLWLSSLPGIGARKFKQLVEHFGSPKAVWDAGHHQLAQIPGIGKAIPAILDKKIRDSIDSTMHKIKGTGVKILRIIDDDYPDNLKNIYDPPPVLYIRGSVEQCDKKAIAIVGSRNATEYGWDMAQELAYHLAVRGITVVSGMARGIDTCAHQGALEAGGRTIAVLGCGVDITYPPENKKLKARIEESGAVVSEFGIGMGPLPGNFPARNRIISGLSMGVLVIEARERSGALITVDFAVEQGREVFAVPGNVKSKGSAGTNKLIRDGAKMVTCVEDILEEFPDLWGMKTISEGKEKRQYANLDKDEIKILENIDSEPVHIDILTRKTGYNIQKVNSVITIMEMKGILKQLPGKYFMRA